MGMCMISTFPWVFIAVFCDFYIILCRQKDPEINVSNFREETAPESLPGAKNGAKCRKYADVKRFFHFHAPKPDFYER